MGAKLGFDGTDAEVHNVGKVNPLQWEIFIADLNMGTRAYTH